MIGSDEILLVAGLGRCGTSLVMQMLSAAGVPCVGTFPDFENEITARPVGGQFVAGAMGKAVKLLDPHRWRLTDGPTYRCIWLTRNPEEQARSMLKLAGLPQSRENRRAMMRSIVRDLPRAKGSLIRARAWDARMIHLRFEDLIQSPEHSARELAAFVRGDLDAQAMAACVIRRQAACLPYMLEHRLLAAAQLERFA